MIRGRTIAGSILLALLTTTAQAESFSATYRAIHKGDKFDVAINDEASGRMVFFSTSKATQTRVSGGGHFDGATGGSIGWWEAIKGVSRGLGFVKYEKGGDIYQTEWNGVCFPVTGADGKGVPTCHGGFVLVPNVGTGRFAGMKGGGRWTAKLLPTGEFEEEWTGTFER